MKMAFIEEPAEVYEYENDDEEEESGQEILLVCSSCHMSARECLETNW